MALLLTRKLGQSLTIGDNIIITVAEIHGGQVRILIDAPRDVAIVRDDAIRKEKKHER